MAVRRLYVEKRQGFFDIPAQQLTADLIETFRLVDLKAARLIIRYDIEGLSDEEYLSARDTVFSEPPVDVIYEENLPDFNDSQIFAIEPLPGQFDQRADSAAQCVQLITQKERPTIRTALVIVLVGKVPRESLGKIKEYMINPIECREASVEKPKTLKLDLTEPLDVEILNDFNAMTPGELEKFRVNRGLAMSLDDLALCQKYFSEMEHRPPTITEIRVLDTYWSDHCRHTTFTTAIDNVSIEPGYFAPLFEKALRLYNDDRDELYGTDTDRDVSLMDIATIGMKALRKAGKLDDLDQSDEVNACSIVVKAEHDGEPEDWLVMFKNETHNHPTEIEPFGGAATCLGGAIRDPLSGRSYVYQAMRLTGAADPRRPVRDTLKGKLPQKKITQNAAAGYSSYGNQIGLATGQVTEVYHEGYMAKRMEIGAVIAAAPKINVARKTPEPGDYIILVGGRTGRDGMGGATGSSKKHTIDSLSTCGAEVQKGNPPTERKIQRLFRNPEVSRMIKRCNDFGAGGVAVAIGELTDGLAIDLDSIPKKYEGLDGTELAISESQERMAVVVASRDANNFIARAEAENLEATIVAFVTDDNRLIMNWRGKEIVNIRRTFLNTNGVKQHANVRLTQPTAQKRYIWQVPPAVSKEEGNLLGAWLANLADLNVCSEKGLGERFDSTIGSSTVLLPYGGKNQMTPQEGMIAKLPMMHGDTVTATAMTFGLNPHFMEWSPFHGALYAVVEAAAKIVALGGNASKIRLSLQEYFESLGNDKNKWGKPFAALLGALWAQHELEIPAIGGKDSMSGTFMDMHVPPTLAAFAVCVMPAKRALSAEFKFPGSSVYIIPVMKDSNDMPNFRQMRLNFSKISLLISKHKVLAAATVRVGGMAATITKMCFGNNVGFKFADLPMRDILFKPDYGTIILEVPSVTSVEDELEGTGYRLLGTTTAVPSIVCGQTVITLADAKEAWTGTLEKIFPTTAKTIGTVPQAMIYSAGPKIASNFHYAKPRVFIPVFPGTNCEYDSARAFENAGAIVDTLVIRNLTPDAIKETVTAIVNGIREAQIVMLAGGFSGGDEPDGSGKFIAAMFRNPRIKEAVMNHLHKQDGLMLGICNGFQALLKLGLLPYGEITDLTDSSPTLSFNTIGRHISTMVQTKVISNLSPWLMGVTPGSLHTIAISHGEGRFVADREIVSKLRVRGQIATQYVDPSGNPTMDMPYNPNGSVFAVEGITSPDGRILGKMGHSERIGENVSINIPGDKDQHIFESGVKYFR
ncbi:MAG: phosphoribosylformylglycinamidine synthase [Schwartzia sp.]|nr:phosphoribosylformylglycinamidine synthase [Schwartzia sp. (in: firmicutes)]